jgi:twitching motility protein PilT
MLKELLNRALDNEVSDIHITSDDFVAFRKSKIIERQKELLSSNQVVEIAKLLARQNYDQLAKNKQLDIGGSLFGVRYRANIYYQKSNLAIAIRIIDNEIGTFEELNLPEQLKEFSKKPHGLILVTGPTGSGKSTTLAAMISEMNSTMRKHIITIEDPIEFEFENEISIIHQRELGADLNSFAEGLRSVLRQDPDVIMIGELRDKLSVETALKASETGHLVLSTLHTGDVKSTINRITGIFNPDEVHVIRKMLSDSLVAIVSQKLIRRKDGDGVIPAFEIMVNTTATANLIRKGETGQLDSYLMMDQRLGSIPMEKSVEELVKKGIINPQR